MATNYYAYFQFSKTQMDSRSESEKRIGNKFIPGKVLVKGKTKNFTEITKVPESKFADAKIVAQGYIDDFKYTMPYTD